MAWKRKQRSTGVRGTSFSRRDRSVVLRYTEPTIDKEALRGKYVDDDEELAKRWTAKRQATLEQAIDNLITYMSLSDEANIVRGRQHDSQVTPRAFPEPECLSFASLPGRKNDDILFFANVTPRDIPSNFDVSICGNKLLPTPDGDRSAYFLQRLRARPLRVARSFHLVSPYVAEYSQCIVWLDSGTFTGQNWLVNWNGRKWTDINRGALSSAIYRDEYSFWESLDPEVEEFNCRILSGVEFTRDLIWRVVIKAPTGVSVSLPTGYAGAMAAFRNRQPNEVTGRRDALRHWVKEHYRVRPETGERDIQVRQHLRGRQPFRWLGLDCELVVAPFDERFNARLAAEKAEARRARGYEPIPRPTQVTPNPPSQP